MPKKITPKESETVETTVIEGGLTLPPEVYGKGRQDHIIVSGMNDKELDETGALEKAENWLKTRQIQNRIGFTQRPDAPVMDCYKQRVGLIPNAYLKTIAVSDDLVATIVNTRSRHLGAFGRRQMNRFDIGYRIKPTASAKAAYPDEASYLKFLDKIAQAERLMETCGDEEGLLATERMDFMEYLSIIARDAVVVGAVATEILRDLVVREGVGRKRVRGFRPIDAGTIYYANPGTDLDRFVGMRREATRRQEQIMGETIESHEEDLYEAPVEYVQVIEATPRQPFTGKELAYQVIYPVSNVEYMGYPVTPIDTVLTAITTHLNIQTHNKMYFQTGRASRGMIVLRSEDATRKTVDAMRQQFNAAINGANLSFRMPVFAVGKEDQIDWKPIDLGSRDMEFQYLADANARAILSAFQMSPEELCAYSHLSRGTAAQSLSESNNMHQLTAHRDAGLRPLMNMIENYVNESILPQVAPEIAEHAKFCFVGLDAETPEKESVRLQQDMPLWMTINDVLEKVEKPTISKEMGGDFLLNPQQWSVWDRYFTVGQIKSFFFNDKEAEKDPQWQYSRDPFWFQWQQFKAAQDLQKQQMEMAAAQAGQQPQEGGQQPQAQDQGGGAQGSEQQGDQPIANLENPNNQGVSSSFSDGSMTHALAQAMQVIQKSEDQIPERQRATHEKRKVLVDQLLKEYQRQAEDAWKQVEASIAGEKMIPTKE